MKRNGHNRKQALQSSGGERRDFFSRAKHSRESQAAQFIEPKFHPVSHEETVAQRWGKTSEMAFLVSYCHIANRSKFSDKKQQVCVMSHESAGQQGGFSWSELTPSCVCGQLWTREVAPWVDGWPYVFGVGWLSV